MQIYVHNTTYACIDLVNRMYMYVCVHRTCVHGPLAVSSFFRSCIVLETIFID